MPGPLAIAGITSAVKGLFSLGDYLSRREQIKALGKETEEEKYLKRLSKEGIYPESVKGKILGTVGARAGGIAHRAVAKTRGELISIGMGRSIAGKRALTEPYIKQIGEISETARQLDIENVLSKERAGREYAGRKSMRELMGTQAKMEASRELFGGLGGAVVSGVSSVIGEYYLGKAEKIEALKPYVKAARAGIRLPYGALKKEQTPEEMYNAMKSLLELFDKENINKRIQ